MLRTRGKDKKKDTFNKYGKNTSRGLRFQLAQVCSDCKNPIDPKPPKHAMPIKSGDGKHVKRICNRKRQHTKTHRTE